MPHSCPHCHSQHDALRPCRSNSLTSGAPQYIATPHYNNAKNQEMLASVARLRHRMGI